MRRLAAVLLLVASAASCRKGDDDAAPRARTLPALSLRDDTADLLLTWVDERGDFHTAMKPAEVPTAAREKVRVVVTTRDEGATSELVYVADLRAARPDGSYAVVTMTRGEWEAVAEARRQARLAAQTPQPTATATAPAPEEKPARGGRIAGASQVQVTVYGASWCGPCHMAQAHLERLGVKPTYRDIEQHPGARDELKAKMARHGGWQGSVPVIDVEGRILQGYDERALEAAVRDAARKGATLLIVHLCAQTHIAPGPRWGLGGDGREGIRALTSRRLWR